jgi:hypothetical protein
VRVPLEPSVATPSGDCASAGRIEARAAASTDAKADAAMAIEREPRSEGQASLSPPAGAADALPMPDPDHWPAFVTKLQLSGITQQLASHTALSEVAGNEIVLSVASEARHLTGKVYSDKLKAALEGALKRRLRLRLESVDTPAETLAVKERRERADAQAQTEAALRSDPFVQDVLSRFDATLKPDTIKRIT